MNSTSNCSNDAITFAIIMLFQSGFMQHGAVSFGFFTGHSEINLVNPHKTGCKLGK